MQNKTKLYLGIGLVALGGYYSYQNLLRAKRIAQANENTQRVSAIGGGYSMPTSPGCPRGQVKCPNSKKCYDPRVNYVQNPCR